MNISYDPHMSVENNKQVGESHTITTSDKYRVVVPTHSPFFYQSLSVTDASGNLLTEGTHYYVTHRYDLATFRTARRCHGSIWIVDDSIKSVKVNYWPLGINEATSAQITAERKANASVVPTHCVWEDVVGQQYFPPVNLIFDEDNWAGEQQVINALSNVEDTVKNSLWDNTKKYTGSNGSTLSNINLYDPDYEHIILPNSFKAGQTWIVKRTVMFRDTDTYSFRACVNSNTTIAWYIDGTKVSTSNQITKGEHVIAMVVTNKVQTPVISVTIEHDGSEYQLPILSDWTPFSQCPDQYNTEPVGSSICISPNGGVWPASTAYVLKKVLTFPTGKARFQIRCDDTSSIYIDGTKYAGNDGWSNEATVEMTLSAGQHTVAIYSYNASIPGYSTFEIYDDDVLVDKSDNTWKGLKVTSTQTVNLLISTPTDNEFVIATSKDWFEMVLDSGVSVTDYVGRFGTEPASMRLLEYLTDTIFADWENSPARAHVLRTDNPHEESWAGIQALQKDAVAQNAAKIYSKSLAELTSYVNNLSLKQSNLSGKALRTGDTLTNGLKFFNILGSVQRSAGRLHYLLWLTKALSFLHHDSAKVVATDSATIKFKAGDNVLALYPDSRGLQFNGVSILDASNIANYAPDSDAAVAGVHASSTDTLTITGNGTTANPLVIEWVEPATSDFTRRLVSSDFGSSAAIGATPALLAKLDTLLATKLKIADATINGYKLSSSIILKGDDLGLGNVSNISDANLPISTAQQTYLDKYSLIGHEHDLSIFGIGSASTTVAGLMKLQNLASDADTGALNVKEIISERDSINQYIEDSADYLPVESVPLIQYGGPGELVTELTPSGLLVTLPANMLYFNTKAYHTSAATFNIAEIVASTTTDFTAYISVTISSGEVTYEVTAAKLADDENRTNIGTITGSAGAIESASVNYVTRLGDFRELDEHKANNQAHYDKPLSRADLGYTNLVDAERSKSMEKPTFQTVFDTWKRFSHGHLGTSVGSNPSTTAYTQPANTLELNGWEYDSATDSIVMPYNTGSYCGFVSPKGYESYTFDTYVSADTSGDNDRIGLLIGFFTDDDGIEHTLTFCFSQDNNMGSYYGYGLVYDYFWSDQHIFSMRPTNNLGGVPSWKSTGGRRCQIIRDGNDYIIKASKSGSETEWEEEFHFNLTENDWRSYIDGTLKQSGTFTDAEVALLSKFTGAQPFGYTTQSQPYSTYKNYQRPDEDVRNFYASAEEVFNVVAPTATMQIFQGTLTAVPSPATQASLISAIGLPTITDSNGDEYTVTKDRCMVYLNGSNYVMVVYLDATLDAN